MAPHQTKPPYGLDPGHRLGEVFLFERIVGHSSALPLTSEHRGDLFMTASWLPDGFHTITPNIIVEDAEQAINFLTEAFGATENYRLCLTDGRITHCELKIGDSIVNLGTAMDGWPAHGLIAQIFVEAPDALFERAVRAGARVIMPMTDMFFGIREGRVSDPFGAEGY
jgi:PhnB protein